MVSRRDLRTVENRMKAEMGIAFRTSVRNAGLSGMATQGSVFEYIARALAARAIPRGRIQRAHQSAGDAGRRAMVAGFTHRRHRRPVASYREGDRFSGGALRRALNNPGMVEATSFTLRFINTDILDAEARHWRRLNFGAGAGSSGGISAPELFPIRWEGMVVATIGLAPDPRPAFTIPIGMFVTPGGQRVRPSVERRGTDMFYPRKTSRVFPTAGIASSNFLDAGVRAIATALPRSYLDMYTSLFNSARISQRLTVRVGPMPAPAPHVS